MAKPQQCPSCGSAIHPSSEFCGNCGAFLSSAGTPTKRIIPPTLRVKAAPTELFPPHQPRKPLLITRIGFLILILFLCGGIGALWRVIQAKDPQTAAPVVTQTVIPVIPSPQGSMVVYLEDTDWQGSYRRVNGPTVYGGRTATWIYGTSTQYNKMRTTFNVTSKPTSIATLNIEGMDAEGSRKTHISIEINGIEIYNGPNPLPDDDYQLDTGTWETRSWQFDTALLRMGQNEITISNLSEGNFSLPPWFMLDYAEITYTLGEK